MTNINREYIEDYIRAITPENENYLREMEEYALENHVPIIEKEVAQFLKVFLKTHRPKKILEIGTAIGYSANIMAEALKGQVDIVTIERNENIIGKARENCEKSPYGRNIRILEGDADQILDTIDEKFDLIFMDAAKGQYIEFFNKCIGKLEKNGIIVADNVLFKGMVATDELVVRRKITIVKRLRKFLEYINQIEGFTSCVIPIGDGVAITYKED